MPGRLARHHGQRQLTHNHSRKPGGTNTAPPGFAVTFCPFKAMPPQRTLLNVARTAGPFALPLVLSAAGLALARAGAPSASRPPAPRIYRHPLALSRGTTARFAFTDARVGTTFMCSLDRRPYRRCSSSQLFRHLHSGAHRFQVEAMDGAGRRSTPASYRWRIGSAAHVIRVSVPTTAPTIVHGPADPTSLSSATLTFSDPAAGVQFLCTIDSRAPTSCTSPLTYSRLALGAHTFRVTAREGVAQQSQAATYTWRVQSSVMITGNAQGALYPGADPSPIPLTLSNGASTRVSITGLTVSIDGSQLPTGCDPSSFQLMQSNVSSVQPLIVPGDGRVTLPAQGITAPSISMRNTNANQDACEGTTLTLLYSESSQP
jgi:hypothetical protein